MCHHVTMVVIHSHILYGLDDGPRTLEESVAMVHMAAASGTTDIVATPHADLRYDFRPEVVEQKISELGEASGGAARIHRGCDFHLCYENIRQALKDPARFTINQKQYLLVEFSDMMIPDSTTEVLERILAAGMTPVITHPERNPLLARGLDRMRHWVDTGCRVQVTAYSFLGRFGSRAKLASEQLIRSGLVHFIASDAHDAKRRPPVMAEAYKHVARRYGKRHAEILFVTNPRAALAGEPVEAALPKPPGRTRKWWGRGGRA
jgi:protein-tyrosine phosphatase